MRPVADAAAAEAPSRSVSGRGGEVERRPPGSTGDIGTLARGGTLNLAGSASAAVLGFVLNVLIARELGARGAGVFYEAIALFTILANAVELGADTGAVREVSRLRALGQGVDVRGVLLVGLVPVLAIGTVVAIAVWAFAPQLANVFIHDASRQAAVSYLRVLAPFIPLAAGSIVALSATRGMGTMVPYVALEGVVKPLLRPILTGVAIVAGLGAASIGLAWSLPIAIEFPLAVFAVFVLLRRDGIGSRIVGAGRSLRAIARSFWAFSAPRGLAAFFQIAILWLNVLLVGALSSSKDAGIYAAASRYATVGFLLMEAIRMAFAPQISALLAGGELGRAERLYQVATTWIVAGSWPIYLTLAVFAPLLLSIFGQEFVAGQHALLILSLTMLINLATGNVTVVLLMGGRSWWNLANTAGALVVNVSLGLWLIPRYGVTGAALAWAGAIVFDNVAALLQVSLLMHLNPFGPGYGRAVVLSTACFAGLGLAARAMFGATVPVFAAFAVVSCATYAWLLWRSRVALDLPELMRALRSRSSRSARPAASSNGRTNGTSGAHEERS